MTKLGLNLNEAKTSVKDARRESFDFLGYTLGPRHFPKGGQWYLGASPSKKSVQRIGVITRAGDEGLRSVLVVGATAVIQHVRRGGRSSRWLSELLKRKSPKLAAVALANKMARIAWKLMVTGENYAAKSALATLAGAA